jgi:tetratricopeptide (TPR) repeat protein
VLTSWQLTALGVTAFNDKEYGLAAQRFQQALDADAAAARPHFLLGQAYIALGKFREAVQIIGVGLGKDPTWPRSDFRPGVDLYLNPADWERHVVLLEQVQAAQPHQAGYLFLLAYARWFDDDRAAAIRLFREVRPLVADPRLVDLFLK